MEVAFEADVDGLVHISATDLLSESRVEVKVASTKLLDPEEIELLKEEARRNEEGDQEKRARIVAGIEADNTIAAAEMKLEAAGLPLSDPALHQIIHAIGGVKEALASGAVEEIRRRCKELRRLFARLPGTGRGLPQP